MPTFVHGPMGRPGDRSATDALLVSPIEVALPRIGARSWTVTQPSRTELSRIRNRTW